MGDGDHRQLEQLAAEYVDRLRTGEAVDFETYAAAHPDLAEKIRELFPVLAMMEGTKPIRPKTAAPAGPAEATDEDSVQLIGPYRIIRELGRGGMGRVYESRGEDGGRVALKTIHAHLVDRPGYLARFLREVEVGQRVSHPGLVETLGSGVADTDGLEVPYLVLEYVEGQNLRDLLDEVGPVSERLCRLIGRRLAEALGAVHAAGIVHRDVKPENVVITRDETVKLMDLGVALLQEEAYRLSQTGEFVGSFLYAAPEQLRGKTPDGRTDLYALGLLLYELSTGRHAEAAGDAKRPQGRNMRGPVSPPSTHAPELSPFFDRVVMRLLARDPDDRFADADELVKVLATGEESGWWRRTQTDADRARRTRRHIERESALRGRAAELELLGDQLERVVEGRGRVVLLRGDAGMGKSRLVHEWIDVVHAGTEPSPRVIVAEHDPGGNALDVPPLGAALAEALHGDDLETTLAGHLGQSACLAGPLARHFRGEEAAAYGVGLPQATLGMAYLMLLRGLARERPLVVVFEDLHFAGEDARAMFLLLARAIDRDAVLLVGTTRPTKDELLAESLERLPHGAQHDLGPLDADACHAVVREVLGQEVTSASSVRDLIQSADGNPFCLIEFARETRRRRAETPGRTARRAESIPTSVRRLLEVRLEALDSEARDLLSVAACCGHRFDPVLVCDASDVSKIRGLRVFQDLDRTHALIKSDGAYYRFQHHLVQELLYADLPPPLRQAYHTALGDALVRRRVGAMPDAEQIEPGTCFELARHFLLGEEPAQAVPYAQRGMRHAVDMGELRRASLMAHRVLELPDLPDRVRASTHLVASECAGHDGTMEQVHTHARAAYDMLAGTDAVAERILAARDLGHALQRLGRPAEGEPILQAALAEAEGLDNAYLLTEILLGILNFHLRTGDHEQAERVGRRALTIAREANDAQSEAYAARSLGTLFVDRSRIEEARAMLEHAWMAAEMVADGSTSCSAISGLSKLAYMEGNAELARELNKQYGSVGRRIGHTGIQVIAATNEATYQLDSGLLEESVEQCSYAARLAEQLGDRDYQANVKLMWARCCDASGRPAETLAHYRDGLALAEAVNSRSVQLGIHARLGALHGFGGQFDAGTEHLRTARSIAQELVGSTHIGLIELAAADLRWARGDHEGAYDQLAGFLEQFERRSVAGHMCRLHQNLGLLAARLDRPDTAKEHLTIAEGIAKPNMMAGFEVACRLMQLVLPGGDPAQARRLALDHSGLIWAHTRVLVLDHAGRMLEDETIRQLASTTLEGMINNAPAEWQTAMKEDVPAYRDVLAGC